MMSEADEFVDQPGKKDVGSYGLCEWTNLIAGGLTQLLKDLLKWDGTSK